MNSVQHQADKLVRTLGLDTRGMSEMAIEAIVQRLERDPGIRAQADVLARRNDLILYLVSLDPAQRNRIKELILKDPSWLDKAAAGVSRT